MNRAWLIALCFVPSLSFAANQEFIRDYTYIASEADSKISARQIALQEVKRELLNEIGTYIYSRIDISENSKGEAYSRQEIRALTAGIVKLETIKERWNGYEFYIQAKLISDPDQVVQHINELVHSDQEQQAWEQQQLASNHETQHLKQQLLQNGHEKQVLKQQLMVGHVEQQELKQQLVENYQFTDSLQGEMQVLQEELSNTRSKQEKLALAIRYAQKSLIISINNDYVKGLNYYWGSKDNKADYLQAAYWFNKAAQKKYSGAQYKLGVIYEKGQGVAPDFKVAMDWYERAAQQGYANAQFKLGALYLKGERVPQDLTKTLHWFSLAAEQGNVEAQLALGDMYLQGQGGTQSNLLSAKWFLAAAHQGEAAAQYQLGLFYRAGLGVQQDYRQAAKWLVKATNQGHQLAKVNLQSLQEAGHF